MANYSDTSIKLHGQKSTEALQYLKSFINDGWLDVNNLNPSDNIAAKAAYASMEIFSIDENESSFQISGSGRWCAPHGFFEMLAEKYELSGYYFDREGGCDFSHLMEFEGGEMVLNVEDSYFSQLAFDYRDIDELVEERSYIIDEEDWENEYASDIALFAKNGITLKDLKERWGVSVHAD